MAYEHSTGISGADAAINSKFDVDVDDKKKELNEKVSKKTKETTVVLQSKIWSNANIKPMNVVLICIAIIVLLWLIHMLYKPNATGLWVATDGQQWDITHCRWSSTINCINNDDVTMSGHISSNLVTINDNIGVWNYGDVILFVGGGSLQRIE
jgi:hypothetical protein